MLVDPRKLEIAWRAVWMRLLGRLLPGPAETTLPSPSNADFRVLFLRYERIGDMIMATSVIRNIATALPSGKVDVLATPTTAPVLERQSVRGPSADAGAQIVSHLRRDHASS